MNEYPSGAGSQNANGQRGKGTRNMRLIYITFPLDLDCVPVDDKDLHG